MAQDNSKWDIDEINDMRNRISDMNAYFAELEDDLPDSLQEAYRVLSEAEEFLDDFLYEDDDD